MNTIPYMIQLVGGEAVFELAYMDCPEFMFFSLETFI